MCALCALRVLVCVARSSFARPPTPHTPRPPHKQKTNKKHNKAVIYQPELSRIYPYLLSICFAGIFVLIGLRKLMIVKWRLVRCLCFFVFLRGKGEKGRLPPSAARSAQQPKPATVPSGVAHVAAPTSRRCCPNNHDARLNNQ